MSDTSIIVIYHALSLSVLYIQIKKYIFVPCVKKQHQYQSCMDIFSVFLSPVLVDH